MSPTAVFVNPTISLNQTTFLFFGKLNFLSPKEVYSKWDKLGDTFWIGVFLGMNLQQWDKLGYLPFNGGCFTQLLEEVDWRMGGLLSLNFEVKKINRFSFPVSLWPKVCGRGLVFTTRKRWGYVFGRSSVVWLFSVVVCCLSLACGGGWLACLVGWLSILFSEFWPLGSIYLPYGPHESQPYVDPIWVIFRRKTLVYS